MHSKYALILLATQKCNISILMKKGIRQLLGDGYSSVNGFHGQKVKWPFINLEKGAHIPCGTKHPNEQITYLMSGR